MPTPVFFSPGEWKVLYIGYTHTHTHKANSDLIVPWEQKLLPGDRMGDPRLRLTLFQSLIKAVFLGTQEQISELLLVFEIVIHGLVSP